MCKLSRHWWLKGWQLPCPLHDSEPIPSHAETYHVYLKTSLLMLVSFTGQRATSIQLIVLFLCFTNPFQIRTSWHLLNRQINILDLYVCVDCFNIPSIDVAPFKKHAKVSQYNYTTTTRSQKCSHVVVMHQELLPLTSGECWRKSLART